MASRWSQRTGRVIDLICLFALIAVIGTVIYGFALRAVWAHGYYIAVGVALIGAVVLMIGLAQQVIAARDAATWHDMATWQLRAATEEIRVHSPEWSAGGGLIGSDNTADYYDKIVKVFIESVKRTVDEV